LWCFPAGPRRTGDRALAPIEHGFTHFRLRIEPLLRDVSAKKRRRGRWMTLAALERAAVPAPVRTLARRLRAAAR
jgi:adenine-specific DNA glycosylase